MAHLIAYGAILAALLCEIPMAAKIFGAAASSFYAVFAFHAASSVLCASGFYFLSDESGRDSRRGNVWWIYALVACAVMPLYGISSTILIYAIQRRVKRLPPPVVSDEITVPASELFAKSVSRNRQLEVLERLDIAPFVDIFRSGQSDLKKSAVKFLSSIKSHSAMNTLNRALMDEDIEVRLYAAGVIGLIDDNYTREIDILSKRFSESPNDSVLGIQLADLYIAYAESGLLDQIASTYYYNETVKVLSSIPESVATNYRLAHCWFILNNLDESKKRIERCLEADARNPDYNRLLCEVLFARREYDATARVVEKMRAEELLPADDELLKFWARI